MRYRIQVVLILTAKAALAPAQTPKHINKAIELLEQRQPIYYTGARGGFEGA